MPSHAAFLRGINLGSRRRISAADLRSAFERMGFDDVATFRTSGNVVFDAKREPAAKLTARIERGLRDSLGHEITVFLRTAAEVRTIAAHEPFDARTVAASAGKLQVALLAKKPSPARRKRALARASDEDRLAFGERELYWLPRGGTRDSELGMAAIDELVGPTTIRTMGTIEQLAAKHLAD